METTTVKEVEGAMPIKSDFEYIRGLDSQGNPIRLNKADVAKVLEELIGTVTSQKDGLMSRNGYIERPIRLNDIEDMDTVINSGYYSIGFEVANTPNNFPSNSYRYGILLVNNTANNIMQMYIPHNNTFPIKTRVRFDGRWNPWR